MCSGIMPEVCLGHDAIPQEKIKENSMKSICRIIYAMTGCCVATCCFGAEAFTETVNGLEWTYRVVEGEAVLGGNNGGSTIPTSTFGAVTIPDTLGGYTVTGVGDNAFRGCNALTRIIIPNTVKYISIYAFRECSGLMTMDVPNGVVSIGGQAFYCCSNMTRLVLPDSVTEIGPSAFGWCSNLSSINLPAALTELSDSVLSGTAITEIVIPAGVTQIGEGAFSYCEALEKATIPKSVVDIESGAFDHSPVSSCRNHIGIYHKNVDVRVFQNLKE